MTPWAGQAIHGTPGGGDFHEAIPSLSWPPMTMGFEDQGQGAARKAVH